MPPIIDNPWRPGLNSRYHTAAPLFLSVRAWVSLILSFYICVEGRTTLWTCSTTSPIPTFPNQRCTYVVCQSLSPIPSLAPVSMRISLCMCVCVLRKRARACVCGCVCVCMRACACAALSLGSGTHFTGFPAHPAERVGGFRCWLRRSVSAGRHRRGCSLGPQSSSITPLHAHHNSISAWA
jgi:hypothetical protein